MNFNKLFDIKNKSLFEIIFSIKHYDIDNAVKDFNKIKNMPHDKFILWQKNKKFEIARYHYKHNSKYKELIGDSFPKDWKDLPVIEKKNLQGNLVDFISDTCTLDKLYINKTSGSSGEPFVFSKDYYTQARVWSARKLFLQKYNLNYTSKQAMFYRKSKGIKNIFIEKIKDFILCRYRFSSTEINEENVKIWINIFKQKRFDFIYGYTSAIVLFCRYLIEKKIILKDICPSLKIVIVTAETCSKEDKDVIQKATGIIVRNEYGSADMGMIAFECEENNFHLVEENLFIETNEQDEILITDLYNISLPFIKFKLGDVAKISSKRCNCGNKNRYIYNFLGRTNDIVILKDGRTFLGYGFYQTLRPILEKDNILKEFFIRQTKYDSFEFDIVATGIYGDNTLTKLTKTTDDYLGISSKIKINYNEYINRPPTGKLKHFYSDIKG